MLAQTFAAAGLLAIGSVACAQSADIRVLSLASPTVNLLPGQEILVTTTVINDGPDPAQKVLMFWSAPVFQEFVLENAQPLTPGCYFEIFDIDPPRFNFTYYFETLAPGEQRTCVTRVRVRVVPTDYQLLVGVDVNGNPNTDPNPSNNLVLYQLTFATPARTPTIPTMSTWGLMVMVAGALSLAFIERAGGRR